MKKRIFYLAPLLVFFACKTKDKSQFEVNGTLTNSQAKMIYLEEIPVATMQSTIVDSAELGKNGRYKMTTAMREATIYNLRLDKNAYPIASVVNDAGQVTVNAIFKDNTGFAESYEVKGSEASTKMKDFMVTFNNKLQQIFINDKKADSLSQAGASDSVIQSLQSASAQTAEEIRTMTLQAINDSKNPALTMFELGYYQSTANNPGFRLQPLSNEEVQAIVNKIATDYPTHEGVAGIKAIMDQQMNQGQGQGWVGQQAPEFSLPDINGNTVKLSSMRGKFVLVDFWASWCAPCRKENPNVVAAWQKFKTKNFDILGVSLDRPGQKEQWLKAIKDDKLGWTQVSDLLFWNSPVVPLYRISGIPYNVLVDPEGKIVAENLRGQQLEAKLAEVLN